MQRLCLLVLAGALVSSACGTGKGDLADLVGHSAPDAGGAGPGPVEHPQPVAGDRWRGFNQMGMYAIQWPETNQGFQELDFATVAELGFNYLRLPLDYRAYTAPADWLSFDQASLGRLDWATAWGQEYGVHVDLCLHRAPGYCSHDASGRIVTLPAAQDVDLWTDDSAQAAFVAHWQMFAERYRNVGNEYLSFNLVNEPPAVDLGSYTTLMKRAIDAIRAISPERLIVVDGLDYARHPVDDAEFIQLENVIQSKHSYDFPKFAFYNTTYTPGSENWPVPSWPPLLMTPYLCGTYHQAENLDVPLVIEGDFPAGTRVAIHVNQVSIKATLVVRADSTTILEQAFVPGPNDSEATTIFLNSAYDIYQNFYDQDYAGTVPQSATSLTFANADTNTDWLSFDSITIQSGATTTVLVPTLDWGAPPATYRLENGIVSLVGYPPGSEQRYDLTHYLDEWKALAAKGTRVMIGEFNQSNRTPHADALRYYEFLLKTYQDAGFGWASWDFDFPNGGGFFNSNRNDVAYEDYRGYRLDRAMLELFQRY